MKCKYCGQEIDDGSLFCGYCGKQQPQTKICINCGQEIDINDVFCGYCGKNQNSQEIESLVYKTEGTTFAHDNEIMEGVPMTSVASSEFTQKQNEETTETEVSNKPTIEEEEDSGNIRRKRWWIVSVVSFLIVIVGATIYYISYASTSCKEETTTTAPTISFDSENLAGMQVKDAIDKGYIIQVSVDIGNTGNGVAYISVKSPSGEIYPTNAEFTSTSEFNTIKEDHQETCGFMGFTEEGKKAMAELYYSICKGNVELYNKEDMGNNGDYDWTDAKSSYFSDNTVIVESATSENDEYSDPIDDIKTELDNVIGYPKDIQIYAVTKDAKLYNSILDERENIIGFEPSNEIIKKGMVITSLVRTAEQTGDYLMFNDGYLQSQPCLASSSINRYTYQYGILPFDILDKAILTFTSTDKSQIKLLKVKTKNCHNIDSKEEGYCYIININNKRLGVLSNENYTTRIRCFTDKMKVLSNGTITKDKDFEADESNCGDGTYCVYIPEIKALCIQDFQMSIKIYYLSEIDIITPTSSTL